MEPGKDPDLGDKVQYFTQVLWELINQIIL